MDLPARKTKPPPPVISTLDDLLAIPEAERRHEIIEGTNYPKGAATEEHGRGKQRENRITK